jgi:hypothetical protein
MESQKQDKESSRIPDGFYSGRDRTLREHNLRMIKHPVLREYRRREAGIARIKDAEKRKEETESLLGWLAKEVEKIE